MHLLKSLLICLFSIGCAAASYGQELLEKRVNFDIKKKPLKDVLQYIGKQGGFNFSYKSDLIKEDSLVSLKVADKSVRQALDQIFAGRFEYKETSNHIIIQPATAYWYVSGYVVDELTGERVINASVYEKQQLVASLTDEHGYFKLKLKDRTPAVINVSKSWYLDTSLVVKPGTADLKLSIAPKTFMLDSINVSSQSQLEKNWLANFFLSSRQRMQSLNLNQFFVDMPYQVSVTPGLSTHGKMSAQVVNKVSFNMFGGYTAGVNGVEFAGLFNIVKHNVRYVHIAGLFNMTGGSVGGLQIGGLYNGILDSANGVIIAGLGNTVTRGVYGTQISGLYNHTLKNMTGAQLSGLGNYIREDLNGTQVAGFANLTSGNSNGVQISGFGNITGKEIDGVQIAGLFNYAKKLDGTQIAVINIADTSTGYSIGLINLVLKGYHKLSISSNEVVNLNAAFKTGNEYLYSILTAGFNVGTNARIFSFGYGLGTNINLSKRFSINPELTAQHLHLGRWDQLNLLCRGEVNLQFKVNKFITLHAGPAISLYNSKPSTSASGYKTEIPGNGIKPNDMGENTSNWSGWNVGIDFF